MCKCGGTKVCISVHNGKEEYFQASVYKCENSACVWLRMGVVVKSTCKVVGESAYRSDEVHEGTPSSVLEARQWALYQEHQGSTACVKT